MHGPIGAKVSRDFIWKNTLPGGGRPARRAVDEAGVAEDMLHGVGLGHPVRPLADHQRELGLALEDAGRTSGRTMVSPSPITAVGALWKALICGSLLERAVLHVVDRHAGRVLPGRGTGGRRRTFLSGMAVVEAAAFSTLALWGIPLLDQADDQVTIVEMMRDVLHGVGDVDDGLSASIHAQAIVVEIAELHCCPPPFKHFLGDIGRRHGGRPSGIEGEDA